MTHPADGFGALGALLGLLSGLAFYLASPNRKVLLNRSVECAGLAAGLLLSAASIASLCAEMSTPAAVFTWLTLAMLALSAVPFAGGLLERTGRRDA